MLIQVIACYNNRVSTRITNDDNFGTAFGSL